MFSIISSHRFLTLWSWAVLLNLLCFSNGSTVLNDDDDVPIYKWSPMWFRNYIDRYQFKRYNEEKPWFNKWDPKWLHRNGYYTNKRDAAPAEPCLREMRYCNPEYTSSQCCPGLKCTYLYYQYLCTESRPSDIAYGKENSNDKREAQQFVNNGQF